MVSDVYWLFPVSSAKLGYVGNGRIVERPKRVLVERFNALFYPDLDAIGKKIVLTQKILLLNLGVKLRIVLFSYGHNKRASVTGPL
jgi:hypothetical protein